jgi:hypothetical protein
MTEPHYCHANGCEVRVPRRMFMCRTHWFMVPRDMRSAINAAYTPGQEKLDGNAWPSDEYLALTRRARDAVATAEEALG